MKDLWDLNHSTIHDVKKSATNQLQDGGTHFAILLTNTVKAVSVASRRVQEDKVHLYDFPRQQK